MIWHNSLRSQAFRVPAEISRVMAEVQTNVKQGAVIGGWVCFGIGMACMILSLWTVIFYAPLFFAAFVLSIVAMAQRRVAGGLTLLLFCVIIPPLTFLGLMAHRVQVSDSLKSRSAPPSLETATPTQSQSVPASSVESATPEIRRAIPVLSASPKGTEEHRR
jgi:hypothetical protein